MPVTHTNRRGQTYFLHAGTTRTGKPRYWFSMKDDGPHVESIPEGYEVHENPDCQVFLRKIMPQLVTPDEVAVIEDGLRRYAPDQNCIVEVQKEHILVYHAERVMIDLALRLRPAGVAALLPELHEGHAVHLSGRRGTDVPGPAVVLPGLDRPLDRPVGVEERGEAARSGQAVLPAHRQGIVL